MDFETQVIEKLDHLTVKVDQVQLAQASMKPVIERHTEQIDTVKVKLFGKNGNPGMERRLDSVEDVTKSIKKVWMALIVAAMLALANFVFGLIQRADNQKPSAQHPEPSTQVSP
jgi:hypothetical protein